MSGMPPSPSSPTNKVLKYGSLAIVIPHSITYTLLGAISRRPDANGNVFYGPSAVFLMEIGKLCISLIGITLTLAHLQSKKDDQAAAESLLSSAPPSYHSSPLLDAKEEKDGHRDVRISVGHHHSESSFARIPQSAAVSLYDRLRAEIITPKALRLCVPALLYALQNNFQVFAAGFLSPAEYQILTQLKLVAGAIFSVLILRKRLNSQRWTSIFTLTIGVSIVQYYSLSATSHAEAAAAAGGGGTATKGTRSHFDLVLGTFLMIGASACSGLAGVLIEALLKGANNIWTTNVHLAFFSLLSASVPILGDVYVNKKIDILRHFNGYVWLLIGFNIFGGVMMAMVLKYADNILEKFAVAISLVGTVMLSSFVSSIPLHVSQLFGAAIVMASAVAYGLA